MTSLFRLLTITCALTLLLGIAPAHAGTVRIATLDWEPYIGQKLENQGYVAEVVREAFAASDHSVEFDFMPWARVVKTAAAGKVNAYGPEYYSDEVAKDFIFSDPFPGGPLGFFKRAGENITWKDLPDLRPYKIGVVQGYVNTEEFDNADYLQKEEVTGDETNIKKLLGGRIDLFVADKFVGKYVAQQVVPEKADQMEFVEPALEEKDLYLCFPRTLANSQALADAFNAGLAKLKDAGRITEIQKKHGL